MSDHHIPRAKVRASDEEADAGPMARYQRQAGKRYSILVNVNSRHRDGGAYGGQAAGLRIFEFVKR